MLSGDVAYALSCWNITPEVQLFGLPGDFMQVTYCLRASLGPTLMIWLQDTC